MASRAQILPRSYLALIAAAILAIGCAAETDRPDSSAGDATTEADVEADDAADPIDVEPVDTATGCVDGVVKECRVELPETAGVKNCAEGLMLCQDGTWSDCSRPDEINALLELASE